MPNDATKLLVPTVADASAVHELIGICKPLDWNSTYAYLLLCHHFSATSVVARAGETLIGFVSGYFLPHDPRTVFLWQVAVHPESRSAGLGTRMLEHLLRRDSLSSIHYVETTVSPSNTVSRRMFQRLAMRLGTNIQEQTLFDKKAFGREGHEEEVLLKIGPFKPPSLREELP